MTATMVAIFAAYETLKTILLPHLSIIGSHVITVIVIGFSSFFISRYTLSKYNEALREGQHRARIINETNRLLSTVLANLKEGVLVVNRQREIVLYNRPASGMLNLRADGEGTDAGPPGWFSTDDKPSDRGRPRLVEATRNPAINEAFRRALEEGVSTDERIELYRPETRSYRLGVAPLPVGLAVGVFYDITELERLEKVRREFFANLSHELRTPLTAILAFSETLLHGAIDDRENNVRFIEKLHKHAVRMSLLISDISDLSAIESGEVRLSIDSVKLNDSIGEIIALVEQAAVRRGVRIERRIPEGLAVRADAKRLGQILHNLIDNAVKFNHDGGRVTISAKPLDGMAEVSVEDTGVGIAEADLPRIFERLYRTDRSRSREIEGTGLGLAIVKHLVQAHGGEISATSEIGSGSTFTFTIPLALAIPEKGESTAAD